MNVALAGEQRLPPVPGGLGPFHHLLGVVARAGLVGPCAVAELSNHELSHAVHRIVAGMGEVMFIRGVGPGRRDVPPASLGKAIVAGLESLRDSWSVNSTDILISIASGVATTIVRSLKTAAEGQTLGAVVESRSARTLVRRAAGIGL